MTSRMTYNRHSTQTLGLVGLLVLTVAAGLLIATYQRVFQDVVRVSVVSDRSGLLLDEGARVRLSGVSVGTVRGTSLQEDGTVKVDIAIDESQAKHVPRDVVASIKATTVFGSKFVDLDIPSTRSRGGVIQPGDTINASSVTVEVNDVFAHGLTLLEAVDPANLNSTLTAVSTGLHGRGEKLGAFFADWDNYLTQFDAHLPTLERDIVAASQVLQTYADVAPALIDTAANVGTTSRSLTANSAELQSLLRRTVTAAGEAESFLQALYGPLMSFNREWLPVSALGAEFAPEIGCVIDTLYEYQKIVTKVIAHNDYSIDGNVGFLPSMDPYTARNLPKYVRGVGPKCYGNGPNPPHVNFDDGTAGTYSDTKQPLQVADNPAKVYLELVQSWLGQSGLEALLPTLTKEQ